VLHPVVKHPVQLREGLGEGSVGSVAGGRKTVLCVDVLQCRSSRYRGWRGVTGWHIRHGLLVSARLTFDGVTLIFDGVLQRERLDNFYWPLP